MVQPIWGCVGRELLRGIVLKRPDPPSPILDGGKERGRVAWAVIEGDQVAAGHLDAREQPGLGTGPVGVGVQIPARIGDLDELVLNGARLGDLRLIDHAHSVVEMLGELRAVEGERRLGAVVPRAYEVGDASRRGNQRACILAEIPAHDRDRARVGLGKHVGAHARGPRQAEFLVDRHFRGVQEVDFKAEALGLQ